MENGSLAGETLGGLTQKYPDLLIGVRHDPNQPFPLLIKIIDAGGRLSLQVHPDGEVCKKYLDAESKTEMWYILANKPNAKIFANLTQIATKQKVLDILTKPEVESMLQIFEARKGDSFFIPTGRLHAIGGGNLILEIQQNSDTTYRVSDWGRLDSDGNSRELHLEKAIESIHFEDRMLPRITGDCSAIKNNRKNSIIVNCPHFIVEELCLVRSYYDATSRYSFHILTAVDNYFYINYLGGKLKIEKGRSCLLPADLGAYNLSLDSSVRIIKTSLKRHY